ncbi:MAG: polysaccharide deacetylase family protein [Mucilaginibacter sp.]
MKTPFTLLLLFAFTVQAQHKMQWPGHKKAAIVLTYDDALESQLNNAVPQLEAARLKATFFLTGDINSVTIPRWRNLAKKGYELGNHTLFHPCAPVDDNPVSSTGYTVQGILSEIQDMNHLLYAVDGKFSRTYAYPCTETTVGNGKDYVDALKKSNLIKYARVGGDTDAIVTDFKHLNPLTVPAYGVDENSSGAQLIAFVKQVEQKGGMGIIMFHGIGGDYITVSSKAHQQLITYLRRHKKDIWVNTFQNTMDYIELQNKLKSSTLN